MGLWIWVMCSVTFLDYGGIVLTVHSDLVDVHFPEPEKQRCLNWSGAVGRLALPRRRSGSCVFPLQYLNQPVILSVTQ